MFTIIHARRNGFTLLEMAVVLVIIGLLVGLVGKTQRVVTPPACAQVTKQQLNRIQQAMQAYELRNGRYPRPASRTAGVADIHFGREVDLLDLGKIHDANNLYYGALPIQPLGLPAEFASDCWGNKFSYVVTKAMTEASSYPDATGMVQLYTGVAGAGQLQAGDLGYIIISHGENARDRGGVPTNYTGADAGWCGLAGNGTDEENCDITNAIFYDSLYATRGNAYFDDIVAYGNRPGANNKTHVYAWGHGGYLGDNTSDNRKAPVKVQLPNSFKPVAISAGRWHACALGTSGRIYCWGENNYGQLGDGTTNGSLVPVQVDMSTMGSDVFVSVSAAYQHTCGSTNTGRVFCWGDNTQGELGNTSGAYETAKPVPLDTSSIGTQNFVSVAAGGLTSCALTQTGISYCWGRNDQGQTGIGATSAFEANPIQTAMGGGLTAFKSLSLGLEHSCGIDSTDALYCWGAGNDGQVLVPTNATPSKQMENVVGSWAGKSSHCMIYNDGTLKAQCIGAHANATGSAQLPVPGGGAYYTEVMAHTVFGCQLTNTGAVTCSGENAFGFGDDSTGIHTTPVALHAPTLLALNINRFEHISVSEEFAIAIGVEN